MTDSLQSKSPQSHKWDKTRRISIHEYTISCGVAGGGWHSIGTAVWRYHFIELPHPATIYAAPIAPRSRAIYDRPSGVVLADVLNDTTMSSLLTYDKFIYVPIKTLRDVLEKR